MALGASSVVQDAEGWSPMHHAAADDLVDVLAALAGSPSTIDPTALVLPPAPVGTLKQKTGTEGILPLPLPSYEGGVDSRSYSAISTEPSISSAETIDRAALMAASELVGHSPMSVSIVRQRGSCCDLLVGLAEKCQPADPLLPRPAISGFPEAARSSESASGLGGGLSPVDSIPTRNPTAAYGGEDTAAAQLRRENAEFAKQAAQANLVDSAALAGIDWTQAGGAFRVGVRLPSESDQPQNQKPRADLAGGLEDHPPAQDPMVPAPMQPVDPSSPLAAAICSAGGAPSATPTPCRVGGWIPSGSVAGLVEVGGDNVLRTSIGNDDVEAWLWHVGGSPPDSGVAEQKIEINHTFLNIC